MDNIDTEYNEFINHIVYNDNKNHPLRTSYTICEINNSYNYNIFIKNMVISFQTNDIELFKQNYLISIYSDNYNICISSNNLLYFNILYGSDHKTQFYEDGLVIIDLNFIDKMILYNGYLCIDIILLTCNVCAPEPYISDVSIEYDLYRLNSLAEYSRNRIATNFTI